MHPLDPSDKMLTSTLQGHSYMIRFSDTTIVYGWKWNHSAFNYEWRLDLRLKRELNKKMQQLIGRQQKKLWKRLLEKIQQGPTADVVAPKEATERQTGANSGTLNNQSNESGSDGMEIEGVQNTRCGKRLGMACYIPECLRAFLEMAGFALSRTYKTQFKKLLNIIYRDFVSALKERGGDAKLNKVITSIQTYAESNKFLEEPEGRYLPAEFFTITRVCS
ncbi:hypothetical protein Acr_06g0001460 [Actinidia rufa]|uniref:mRNA export factor GLE1 n=1 Tax=Actinidia rufa TaxID=165716 RepID=A0A7J0EPS5_9ERIC|nr:hypothetical protein Acr_06g0001460 [Actinidia rufa]